MLNHPLLLKYRNEDIVNNGFFVKREVMGVDEDLISEIHGLFDTNTQMIRYMINYNLHN